MSCFSRVPEDEQFWRGFDIGRITRRRILAMDDLEAKLISARALRQKGFFSGPIVAHAYCKKPTRGNRSARRGPIAPT